MLELLKGVRIVDFTTVVLGPYATQTLADLGAEVVKVEPISGDAFRAVRPGYREDMGAGYLNLNRNKRSIALDLRKKEGLEVVHRLVAGADIAIHNMRPASAERLGIGFEQLKAINPRIVYCFTAGFGSDGPYSAEPAYDDIIQARSGLAALNANAAGEPRFLPTIIADKVGGLHLAIGALSAFLARERTDEAIKLEVPMFESMVSFLLVEQLAGRSFVPPLGDIGYERLLSPFRKPYRTADGFIAVLPYNTNHWVRFLKLIEREDLVEDSRVTDPVERSRNIDMLYELIEKSMVARPTDEWLSLLGARDIPCTPVNSLERLFDDPHLTDVGMFKQVIHPSEGEMLSVRSPFLSGSSTCDGPAPSLGGNSAEILEELGYSTAEIAAFSRNGIVANADAAVEGEQ